MIYQKILKRLNSPIYVWVILIFAGLTLMSTKQLNSIEFEVKPWELTDLEIEANLNEKCLSGRIDTFEIDTTMYHQIDEFPRFPGCEYDHMDEQEKRKCSEIKLLNYLYVNLKYPQKARRKGIEGRVFIQFVIEKDGSIAESRIVKDIGSGAGQSALDVVNRMNQLPQKWTPGKKGGEAVRVLYTLPVTFTLNKKKN
jgi:TonB family protein